MADISFRVEYYSTTVQRQVDPVVGTNDGRPAAEILCSSNGSPSPQQMKRLSVRFWTNGIDRSMSNSLRVHQAGGAVAVMHLPIERYALTLDMLRNESPVLVHLDDANLTLHRVTTNAEPAGSGDTD